MIRFETKKPEVLSNTKSNTRAQSNKPEMAGGAVRELGTAGKFDKVAYQRDYMRKRRAAKKASS